MRRRRASTISPGHVTETPYHPPPNGLWADQLRFDRGAWTWRSRGTPDCLLMVGLSGQGLVRHEQGTTTVGRGDCVLVMPDTPHDYGVEDGHSWTVAWTHFRPSITQPERLRWPELSSGMLHLLVEDEARLLEIAGCLQKAHLRLRDATGAGHDLAENAIQEALLLCETVNPLRTAFDPRIRQAISYVCRHLTRAIRLREVALACELSVSRLCHLFRAQTGTSLQAFLESRRMEQARQRLSLTGEAISHIAADLGFSTPFYFSRRFTNQTGMSPSAFRHRARQALPDQAQGPTRRPAQRPDRIRSGKPPRQPPLTPVRQ